LADCSIGSPRFFLQNKSCFPQGEQLFCCHGSFSPLIIESMIHRHTVQALHDRLRRLGIDTRDLEEEFIRGSGPGGQKINKTSSTVRLRHAPSGVDVRCQEERSLAMNRLAARVRLCEILEKRRSQSQAEAKAEREKKRRQTRQRSRAQKAIMRESKRQRGETKSLRRKPEAD
jgi:peptide chain release factor